MKVACHVHSDWSYDGRWSLHRLAAEFQRRRYSVLMMTEHDRGFSEARRLEHRAACAEATTREMRVIPGIEYSDAENLVHILVWGDVPFAGEGLPTLDLLQAVARVGGVSVFAHPSRRSAWRQFQPAWVPLLSGIELWNRKTDGWAPSADAAGILATNALPAYVGMDFHDRRQFWPLSMEMPWEGPVSEGTLIDAIWRHQVRASAFGRALPRDPRPLPWGALRWPEALRARLAVGLRRTRHWFTSTAIGKPRRAA